MKFERALPIMVGLFCCVVRYCQLFWKLGWSKVAVCERSLKIPLWHFIGLGLLAVLIGIGIYTAINKNKLNLEYLADPKVDFVGKI